jgi:hypothetical protein
MDSSMSTTPKSRAALALDGAILGALVGGISGLMIGGMLWSLKQQGRGTDNPKLAPTNLTLASMGVFTVVGAVTGARSAQKLVVRSTR